MHRIIAAAISLIAIIMTANLAFAEAKTLCVYDPGGASGDAYQIIKDYRTAAAGWGVEFTLKPYTDEKTAADDFKAGQCDAVVLTGTRVRRFQKFSGTIEAMGGLPTYAHLKKVVKALANPKAGKLLKSGDFETAGILPGGAVYLLVNDRSINTVEKMAGKRLAVLEYDKAAKVMVSHVGASSVSAAIMVPVPDLPYTNSGMNGRTNPSPSAGFGPSLSLPIPMNLALPRAYSFALALAPKSLAPHSFTRAFVLVVLNVLVWRSVSTSFAIMLRL